jgi:hypothetical protein
MLRHMALIASLVLCAGPALCQTVGEKCSKLGETIVSEDRKSILTCLSAGLDPSGTGLLLVWIPNATGAPNFWQNGTKPGSAFDSDTTPVAPK